MSNLLKKRYKTKVLNSPKGGEIKDLMALISTNSIEIFTLIISECGPLCIKDDENEYEEEGDCQCLVCSPHDEPFEDLVFKFPIEQN